MTYKIVAIKNKCLPLVVWADDTWLKEHSGQTLSGIGNTETAGDEEGEPEEGEGEGGTKRPATEQDTVS